MKSLVSRLACIGLLYAPALFGAEGGAPRRFAAPDVATVPAPGSAGGIGQVMLALIVVLVAVFAAAWLLKRLRGFNAGSANGSEGVAQTSLGSKERAVIVRVAGERLLLGVASGQVTLLQTLPPETDLPAPLPTSLEPQRFTELLRRSLGK
jgi:flagellar protein FliO/FliZ